MPFLRTFVWIAFVFELGCTLGGASPGAPSKACQRLRDARAEVWDVSAGVELRLRVEGSELEVVTLQDYVAHLVNAWNEAEQGLVQRCYPRARLSTGLEMVASTAELTLPLDGAQIVFKPVDPAQLIVLREHVHRARARTLACACDAGPAGF